MTKNCKIKQKKSSEKGITIVALAITIFLLLTLAGVSISSMVGEDSVVESTKKGVNKITAEEDSLQNDLNNLLNKVDQELRTETQEPLPPENINY